jgi:hypothetical protein
VDLETVAMVLDGLGIMRREVNDAANYRNVFNFGNVYFIL